MSHQDCEVYIYDLEGCKHEIDDPLDSAVVYSNRPDNPEHVLIITGQLIGIAQFGLSSSFGFPSKIVLQNGAQFSLTQHGRFVLIVGEISFPDDDSEERVQELIQEIGDRLHFFRGVKSLNEWYEESPFMFKRRVSRFLEAVLSNASSYCRPERGFFQDDLDSSDLEVTEISISILTQCMEAYNGVLCGALIRENRVLYQNFPRKVFKKLQVLLNEREKSLDTSFCKVYEDNPKRMPLGLDVFSIFISPDEAKELRHANTHFLNESHPIKKTALEEISDAIRKHNHAKIIEKNILETKSIGFVLLVIKVDLLRLILTMEIKIDRVQNMENIKRIWSIGFTKLPKLIDL